MSFGPTHLGGSFRARLSMTARRLWLGALAGCALAAALAAPSAALAAAPHEHVTGSVRAWRPALRGTPTEVIDAKTEPKAAGQALNTGCANLSNCSWQADPNITIGYGPPRVLGDALYNCSAQAYAETAVGISDEREESTSISESLSVEVGLGFLGFEKATAGFEAFSKQSESFSTEVSSTSAVAVPPMWKGWTETEVLTAVVSGSAYITQGINGLIQVKGIDLSFPGYQDPNDTQDTPIKYIGTHGLMTAEDIATRCGAINGLGGVKLGAPPPVNRLPPPTGSFELTLCRPGDGCVTRKVTGTRPPRIRQGTATLTRGGRTYATGSDAGGRIQLTVRQPISAGNYTLTIQEAMARPPGGRGGAMSALNTIVPVRIR